MAKIISAQSHRDDAIIAEKLVNRDFAVQLSPVFEIDGEQYQVVCDGHHSLTAALQVGVEPEYTVQTVSQNDTIAMLTDGRIEDFLTTHRIDCDYYDIATGLPVW